KATDAQGFSVAIKFVQLGGRLGEKELRSLDVIKEVRHPHLLTIFGTRQLDDVLAIAMELADRTLMSRLEEARKEGYEGIPRDELLEYMAEAAKGIDFLNDPGSSGRPRIQHRDIKPQNLLLSGNSVKIADYSLAQSLTFKVADSTGSTPAYAAPEFFDGNTTSQSDQYSLAVTYCLLRGGRLPFEGSLTDLMQAHRSRDPDLSMIPAEERPAVAKALAKKPKDRWTSCSEFVSALKAKDDPVSLVGLLRDLPTQAKIIGGSVGAFLILLLLLLTFSFFGGGNDPQPQSPTTRAAQTQADGQEDHELTVAVLDFANHSKDPALEGYRLGFRDMLTTDLSKLSSIKVLERARLDALLKEHDLAKTDFIDADTAVRLRKGLSAHAMLSGSYIISGDDIRVDVRLVSVETGEVIQADAVEGKKSDMFGL
ncbi:MAG TPA: serine/threonine-protein kinase, partial [Pirellulaceae bacterium]|nr:serine/threonine-protein kinase [Pirellulaceae bacterium]